jgi:hypothetical protein
MSAWKVIAAISATIVATATTLPYAQQRRAGGTLTTQDYIEIQQLYATYAQAYDRGETAKYVGTFTADGEFWGGYATTGGGRASRLPYKGTEELTKMGSDGGRGSRHWTSNLVITPTPEGANGSCYLIVYDTKSVPPKMEETAIYDDTLVKTSQGWKFKKRMRWLDGDDMSPYNPNRKK